MRLSYKISNFSSKNQENFELSDFKLCVPTPNSETIDNIVLLFLSTLS